MILLYHHLNGNIYNEIDKKGNEYNLPVSTHMRDNKVLAARIFIVTATLGALYINMV